MSYDINVDVYCYYEFTGDGVLIIESRKTIIRGEDTHASHHANIGAIRCRLLRRWSVLSRQVTRSERLASVVCY